MSYRFFSNLCFLLFAAMLVSSLLISIVAAARSLRRRAKTRGTELTSASAPPVGGRLADVLLLIAVAATWYNVSSGWIAELTIYPIYAPIRSPGLSRLQQSVPVPASNHHPSRWRYVSVLVASALDPLSRRTVAPHLVDHRPVHCVCGQHAASRRGPGSDV
jgi:hypothetical protein